MQSTAQQLAEYVTFLEQGPAALVQQMSPAQKMAFAQALTPTTFFKGDVVIRQGDVANCLSARPPERSRSLLGGVP